MKEEKREREREKEKGRENARKSCYECSRKEKEGKNRKVYSDWKD